VHLLLSFYNGARTARKNDSGIYGTKGKPETNKKIKYGHFVTSNTVIK